MIKKIINRLLLALLLFCFFYCKNENKQVLPPSNILSEEAFVKVLVDFSLAESAANINIKNVPVIKLDSVYAFDPLKENKVRRSQYDSTLLFYSQNADLYKKVNETVLAQLNELQAERSAKADSSHK